MNTHDTNSIGTFVAAPYGAKVGITDAVVFKKKGAKFSGSAFKFVVKKYPHLMSYIISPGQLYKHPASYVAQESKLKL